jgi:hypothetical protein
MPPWPSKCLVCGYGKKEELLGGALAATVARRGRVHLHIAPPPTPRFQARRYAAADLRNVWRRPSGVQVIQSHCDRADHVGAAVVARFLVMTTIY